MAKKLDLEIAESDITNFLREELGKEVILLIDGVDQIAGAGTAYDDFLRRLINVYTDCLCMIFNRCRESFYLWLRD